MKHCRVSLLALLIACSCWPFSGAPAQVIQVGNQTVNLATLTLVPPAALPSFGSFYSLHRPNWPPLPAVPPAYADAGVLVYWLGGNHYLIDDTAVDWDALQAQQQLAQAAAGLSAFDSQQLDGNSGLGLMSSSYGPTDLWLELVAVTNSIAQLLVHTPETDAVYDLFQTPSLATNGWVWVARGLPGQMEFSLTNLPPEGAFYVLGTTNGMDANGVTTAYRTLIGGEETLARDTDDDGLPDVWEILNFGDRNQSWDGDYDEDKATNWQEFLAGTDPNTLSLMAKFDALQTTNRTVAGTCLMFGGVPAQMAVLVNSTDLATAAWVPFAASFTATLPDSDGVHTVVLAVRGQSPLMPAVLDATDITLDRVPPILCLTNPATATITVIKPYLQLQGWANEPLASLTYDLINATSTLTNEPAFVVNQYFDTNRFDFTTNYFQAYDLKLTNGANAITLRLSDLAGNVTTTNLSVTLSYASATNSPVLALIWPTNGTALSGDTFFLRGRINDETARLWAESVGGGVTNEFPGLVERDGMFWVESLPLATGTNWFSVKALDAAGNLSSTNLAVVKSSVSLAITSMPEGDALYTAFGTVSGTVTATNPAYSVTVNGVAAAVDAYGNWTATVVPVLGQGTALFTAVATGNGASSPVGVAVEREMPARIEIVEHHADKAQTEAYSGGPTIIITRGKDYLASLQPRTGGDWSKCVSASVWDTYTNAPWWHQIIYLWTTTNASSQCSDVNNTWETSPTFEDLDGSIQAVPERDVRYPAIQSSVIFYLTHYYAQAVRHAWLYPNAYCPDWAVASAQVNSRTVMKLYTGGKSGSDRRHLIHIEAWAEQYGRPPGGRGPSEFPWYDTPVTNIPPTNIFVLGEPLIPRSSDSKGDRYIVLPDNSIGNLGLQAPGVRHYGAWATATSHKLVHETVCSALTDTNLARTQLGVGEYVQCRIEPDTIPTNAVWTASAGSFDPEVGNSVLYTAPSNAANATVTANLTSTARLTIHFDVKEPTGVDHALVRETVPQGSGFWGAEAYLTVFIAPTDVSFSRVEIQEVGQAATNVWGRYAVFTNGFFTPKQLEHDGSPFRGISCDNRWNAYGNPEGDWISTFMAPPQYAGGYTWPVPANWRIPGALEHSLTNWSPQVITVATNGITRITKFGTWVERTTNDVYTTKP